jgi:hypothetical protein
VIQEVEDRLCEAVAADRTHDRLEAERRAIANFGDPHVLATQFAVVSLVRRTRRVGIAVALAIVAVLAAMKARVAWYAVVQWTMSEDARELGAIVISIDRFAFWLAAISGMAALIQIGRHGAPAAFHPGDRKQLRRVFLLCACATGALTVSVISDGVLTALQLGMELCAGSVVPIISMAVEIACAGAVIGLILHTMRRAASTEALVESPARVGR